MSIEIHQVRQAIGYEAHNKQISRVFWRWLFNSEYASHDTHAHVTVFVPLPLRSALGSEVSGVSSLSATCSQHFPFRNIWQVMLEICTRPNLLKHLYRRNSRYILFGKGEGTFSITNLILKISLCDYTVGHFTSLYQLLILLLMTWQWKDKSVLRILQEEILSMQDHENRLAWVRVR
jgi:hypothetical protein